MAEVGSAFVTLVPSARGFGSATEKQVGPELNKSGGRVGKAFGTAIKAGALAVAATAAIGVAFAKDAIQAASDLGETVAKTNQIFGNRAGNYLARWADDAATSMGQSKQQALDAAATFGVFGKSAGLRGEDLAHFSTKFTHLASDLASFNNAEPQEAIDAIGAALRGEAEPIRRFGVLLDDATLRQEALRLGLIKNTKQALKPHQKVLAAEAAIYKQTADAQGDFERTSGGLANQQRILSAQWQDLKTDLGAGLLPIATRVFGFLNDTAIPAVRDLGPAFQQIGGFITPVAENIRGFFTSFGSGENRAKLEEIRTVAMSVFNGIRDVVVAVFPQVRQTVASVFASVKSIFFDAVTIIRVLWNAFGANLLRYLKSTFNNILQVVRGAFQIIAGIFKLIKSVLTGDWRGAWEAIKQILRGAWNVIVGLVKQGWNVIRTAFSSAGTILRGIFSRIWDGIQQLARAAWDGIQDIVSDGASDLIAAIRAVPGKIISSALGLFQNAGRRLIEGFVNAMRGAGGLVADIAGNVWDAVRGMLNSAISQLNSALEFRIDTPGPGGITINPPNIPMLASGGVVTRATLAVIGEGSEDEAVLPLSKLSGMLARARSAGAESAPSGGGLHGRRLYLVLDDGTSLGGYIDERIDSAADLAAEYARAGGRR